MVQLFKYLMELLDKREKYLFALVLGASFVGSLIEIVGMTTMAPFMVSVMSTGSPPSILLKIHSFANGFYQTDLPTFLGVVAVIGMSASVVSAFATSNLQIKVSSILTKRWGKRVYENILLKDHDAIATMHTSELQLLFNTHMGRALLNVLAPAFTLFSKSILLLCIGILSFIYNPLLTCGIGAFYLLLGSSLYKMGKKTLEQTGSAVTEKSIAREKFLVESLAQLKLIKLWNKSSLFTESFTRHDYKLQDLLFKATTWPFIPRYILEIVSYITMVSVSLLVLKTANTKEQVITIISLFALAAYRALPSVQAIITNSSLIRANLDAFDLLRPYLIDNSKTNQDITEIDKDWKSITFRNVSYTYPNSDKESLTNTNVNFSRTGLHVVIGKSGSGKSTLLNLLLGLTSPTRGEILVGQQTLSRKSSQSWQKTLGYVPQEIILFDETLEFNISLGETMASPGDLENIEKCLNQVALLQFTDFLKKDTAFRMGQGGKNISGGQRQRLGLARALYRNSQLIVLDEITSNLDILTEAKIIETVKDISKNTCVIWVTHSQRVAEVADKLLFLQNGKVEYEGSYSTLLDKKNTFKSIFEEI